MNELGIIFYTLLIALQETPMGAGRDGNWWTGLFGVNWVEILQILAAGIGTFFTGKWARDQFFAKKESDDKTSADQLQLQYLKNIQDEYRDLRVQHNSLQKLVLELQHEVSVLRSELAFYKDNKLASQAREMIKLLLNDREHPNWIHDLGTNKCYVNDAYCDFFSVSRQDFWSPINILARFSDTTVGEMLTRELTVISAGIPLLFEEVFNRDIMNPESPYKVRVQVRRSPFKISDNNYVFGEIVKILEEDIPRG